MKEILAFFLLLTTFFWPCASIAEDALPQGDFSELRRMGIAKVQQVIDPYTLQLDDGTIIRLIGLNFPDFSINEAGDFSVTARDILKDMLVGESVVIYQTRKKDWGRTNRLGQELAHIERQSDKTWAQGALLSLGLARVQTGKRNPEMASQMYGLEEEARGHKLGLWENEAFKILTSEETSAHIGSFQIVESVIESVATKKNRIYLNFGKNWRDDFTVSIAPEDKRSFSKQGLDPMTWNGKKLRIRGWLESYNGPMIEINHPQAIEILDQTTPLQVPNKAPMVGHIGSNH